uniref:Uncharacterized protein n=1 Tax=Pristhesancus plagipennis TaxID=1955184 RepID=A0A2K8JSE6_PRIPG|nr:secreted hypothetical protein [Pristhesancus plagipennis]
MYKISIILLTSFLIGYCVSQPTIYMKNNDKKLSPVLVPVSSTVIPLPIYKVEYAIFGKGDGKKYVDEDDKLITAKKRKLYKGKVAAAVKPISREAYEGKGYL